MKSDYTTNSRYITHTIAFWKVGRIHFLSSGVKGLTHISVYTAHKNLAVRKLMEVIVTVYTKSGFSLTTSQTARGRRSQKADKYRERKAHIVCEQHFSISLNRLMVVNKGAFEMRHLFLYFVGTYFRISVCKCLIHLHTVYASPQQLARPLGKNRRWSWLQRIVSDDDDALTMMILYCRLPWCISWMTLSTSLLASMAVWWQVLSQSQWSLLSAKTWAHDLIVRGLFTLFPWLLYSTQFPGCKQIGFLLGSCSVSWALTSDACQKTLPKDESGHLCTFRGTVHTVGLECFMTLCSLCLCQERQQSGISGE